MYCEHLTLASFRNFARLDLDLPQGLTIILGNNAQGKSNLLEAVYVMATTKSFRASGDRDLISWHSVDDGPLFARLVGQVRRDQRSLQFEIVVKEEASTVNGVDGTTTSGIVKKIKLNGVAKRALDVIGEVNVVMFSPQDIDIVIGPPVLRRRYIDVTISQVDPRYCRCLAHLNRVLVHRNHLLRQIRERLARPDQLEFWDREMVEAGSYVTLRRIETIDAIDSLAGDSHRHLTDNRESLRVSYRLSLDNAEDGPRASRLADALEVCASEESRLAAIHEVYAQRVSGLRAREISHGMTLVGPQRDDLLFTVDQHDVSSLGSRGQQRTVALALKMAEADFMNQRTGTYPILLLDDVMSELDRGRRRQVLDMTMLSQQVLVTATDRFVFEPEALARANILTVERGVVEEAQPQPSTR